MPVPAVPPPPPKRYLEASSLHKKDRRKWLNMTIIHNHTTSMFSIYMFNIIHIQHAIHISTSGKNWEMPSVFSNLLRSRPVTQLQVRENQHLGRWSPRWSPSDVTSSNLGGREVFLRIPQDISRYLKISQDISRFRVSTCFYRFLHVSTAGVEDLSLAAESH